MSESKQLTVVEQPQQVALTALDRAVIALGGTEREDALKALAKKYADITEVKNKAGRQQVHAAAMELANERIATKKTGETAREDANALQKAVIDRQKVLIGIVEPEEKRLIALRDKFDEAEEAEKQAKAAAEQARITKIKNRIEAFMLDAVSAIAGTAAEIDAYATRLSETVISLEEFSEFAGEAQVKRDNTVKWLRERQQQAVEQEAEAARIAAERVQLERERAEAAERERIAALARAEREAKDRAERERVAAEQQAAQERAAEAMRQQQAEHEARMAAQQAEIDRQQAAIDAERQRQADEAARVEREKQAAIAAEAARVAQEERRKREVTEAAARAEAQRIESARIAAEIEALRREREQFAINGPGDVEIIETLAKHYNVEIGDVMEWIKKFDYAAADEHFAAANVAANHLEKAA